MTDLLLAVGVFVLAGMVLLILVTLSTGASGWNQGAGK